MIKKGFTFFYNSIDYFIETEQKNKTEKFIKSVCKALNKEPTENNIKFLMFRLQKANCEIKTLSNGRQYYDIYGDNFGGRGSFINDGFTKIIKI